MAASSIRRLTRAGSSNVQPAGWRFDDWANRQPTTTEDSYQSPRRSVARVLIVLPASLPSRTCCGGGASLGRTPRLRISRSSGGHEARMRSRRAFHSPLARPKISSGPSFLGRCDFAPVLHPCRRLAAGGRSGFVLVLAHLRRIATHQT